MNRAVVVLAQLCILCDFCKGLGVKHGMEWIYGCWIPLPFFFRTHSAQCEQYTLYTFKGDHVI